MTAYIYGRLANDNPPGFRSWPSTPPLYLPTHRCCSPVPHPESHLLSCTYALPAQTLKHPGYLQCSQELPACQMTWSLFQPLSLFFSI